MNAIVTGEVKMSSDATNSFPLRHREYSVTEVIASSLKGMQGVACACISLQVIAVQCRSLQFSAGHCRSVEVNAVQCRSLELNH